MIVQVGRYVRVVEVKVEVRPYMQVVSSCEGVMGFPPSLHCKVCVSEEQYRLSPVHSSRNKYEHVR